MDEQILSIEQMQELIDMGVDTSNASCIWWNFADLGFASMPLDDGRNPITIEKMKENHGAENIVPTFTLQDILVILSNIKEYVWVLNESGIILEDLKGNEFHREHHGNLIQAAFNMLKWCKENGHI